MSLAPGPRRRLAAGCRADRVQAATMAATIAGTLAISGCDGCSGDIGPAGPGGGGAGGDGSGTTTTTSAVGGGDGTSCEDGYRLGSTDSELGVWGTGVIDPAGDRDYFRFEATAGQWLAIATNANAYAAVGLVDTVLTLWNEDGTEQLAENDDAMAWDTADSEILFRVPESGSYCLQVWERSDWSGGEAVGRPSFSYDVGAVRIDFELMKGFTLDTDPEPANDTVASAQSPPPAAVEMWHTAGLLEPRTDRDLYLVRPAADDADLALWIGGDGPTLYGATVLPETVTVLAHDGETIMAQIHGVTAQNRHLYLRLPKFVPKLYFELTRPDAAVGANDFYVFKHCFDCLGAAYQDEQDDWGNDDPLTAELVDQSAGTAVQAQIAGTLAVGDTDFWSFEAQAGDQLAVHCAGQRWGSALRGMHVALFADGAPGIPLAEETETDLADLDWSPAYPGAGSGPVVPVGTTGTYQLAVDLVTGSEDPTIANATYYCRLAAHRPYVVLP